MKKSNIQCENRCTVENINPHWAWNNTHHTQTQTSDEQLRLLLSLLLLYTSGFLKRSWLYKPNLVRYFNDRKCACVVCVDDRRIRAIFILGAHLSNIPRILIPYICSNHYSIYYSNRAWKSHLNENIKICPYLRPPVLYGNALKQRPGAWGP